MTSRTKQLGLAGLVLGGAAGLSSCAEFLGALLIADHHAHVVARGERDAAQIQANANRSEDRSRNHLYLTCNSFSDSNGDGYAEPDEFVGIKDRFSTDESILFVGLVHNRPGQEIKLEIYDKNQMKISSRKMVTGGDSNHLEWVTAGDEFKYCSDSFNPGSYLALWKSWDGNLIGSKTFEVYSK